MSEQNQRDDLLFDQLRNSKKKKRRKILTTVGIVLLVVAVVLLVAVIRLRASVRERFAGTGEEVLSYTAETGTLHSVVSGSGMIGYVDEEDITVPAGVEIDSVPVSRQDTVAKGDILATVDMATVLEALADTQQTIDDLDDDIHDAESDKASTTVTAGVTGRVKLVYGQAGDNVADVMAEYGALAVLSVDGYLSLNLDTDALAAGEEVTVTRADGTELSGTVETVVGTTATILVSDDGTTVGEEVTVSAEGSTLGTGTLEIHAPLRITGYAGTIRSVQAAENKKVYSGTQLFTLTDTQVATNYQSLLRSREEQEEILLELLTIYQNGAVLAPYDGLVSSVSYDEDTADSTAEQTILTLTPNAAMEVTISVGESDILSLEEGLEAQVTVSSVSEEAFTGTVTEVTHTTTTSGTYSATVSFPMQQGLRMLPGMSADVEVQIQGVEDAVLVPVDAVHQTSAISYVYTSYNAETQEYGGMVEVTTGLWGDKYVEITSGLNPGDVVYYTEKQSFSFGFGAMPGNFSADDLPINKIMNNQNGGGDFGGGDFGGGGSFGGGSMPDMGGSRPDGGGRP